MSRSSKAIFMAPNWQETEGLWSGNKRAQEHKTTPVDYALMQFDYGWKKITVDGSGARGTIPCIRSWLEHYSSFFHLK
jgi:hypothetical protein